MLNSPQAEDRIIAAQVLGVMGPEAKEAIPALIDNLAYPYTSDVRRAAAQALGQFGPASQAAVPALVRALHAMDADVQEQRAIIHALGRIGVPTVLPDLAPKLYDDDTGTTIITAEAIAMLAHQSFPDQGTRGYRSGEDGVPLIVAAARMWWEQEGKGRDWTSPK